MYIGSHISASKGFEAMGKQALNDESLRCQGECPKLFDGDVSG